jgi:zinc transport system ATP-binding protein
VLLRASSLVVGWNGEALLPPIDVAVRAGEVLAVVGRNGSGKSTWFKTMLGLTPPVSGSIERAAGARVAYVPQSTALDPLLPLAAIDVVAWGRLSSWSFLRPFASRADRDACRHALAQVGAGDLATRALRELSKGQRQRVMFARLLAAEADVVLLDEPTAAMDAVAEREAAELLLRLARDRGMAVVVVSHDQELPSRWADRVMICDREGGQVVVGSRDEVIAHGAFARHYGEA